LSTLKEATGEPLFERVVSGSSLVDRLTSAPANLSEAAAIRRLKGALLGPDGLQSGVVVWLTADARRDIHATLSLIRNQVSACGIAASDVKMGGPPVVNAAIDEVSARSLNQLIPLTCSVGLVIAWCAIRSLRLTIFILSTSLYAMAASLAALWVCGVRMNGLLITMVPLVYVVSTSGAIHLCTNYRQCVRKGGKVGAADRAMRHAMVPVSLAAGTTIAGLLSICYNDLVPIQLFGLFAAIGTGLSWLLLVLWLPAALAVLPGRNADVDNVGGNPEPPDELDTGEAPLPALWRSIGAMVIGRHVYTVTAFLLVMVVCLIGLSKVRISIDVMQEFTADAPIIRDYTWLEQRVGPLVPLEVVVRIHNAECPLNMLARARLVERMQRNIEALDEVGGAISAVTFGPDLRRRGGFQLRERVLNRQFELHRDALIESGYLATDAGEELWRISARVRALQQIDYAEFIQRIKTAVEQALRAEPNSESRGISMVYTGMPPVLFKARRSLVNGLIWGLGTDLVLIVVAMTCAMRHWSSGLLMLLTSLFPTAIVLGSAGWLGMTLNQGALLAPCVALGVSVDDVIHFLIWFRLGIRRGLGQQQAVWLAWQACARPMYQSWALLGLGMATLGVSAFVPILHFGWTMVAMLTVGLIANLFLLPTLLAGPLGAAIAKACTPPR
jgi:predicted RND superfamily exporter protein